MFALALEALAFAVLWWGANLLAAVPRARRHPVLRVRLHALAEAHEPPERRHRRRGRCGAGARRLGRGDRTASAGRRSCCSSSSSCGRRRTRGRWPSATPTTTAPPTCRCCPPSRSMHDTTRTMIGYTVALVACTLVLVPGRRPRLDLQRSPPSWSAALFVVGARSTSAAGRRLQRSMRLFAFSITYITAAVRRAHDRRPGAPRGVTVSCRFAPLVIARRMISARGAPCG